MVSLVKVAWKPDHTDAELKQRDVVDKVSEAWPIGSQVEATWEGGEITDYRDAIIGWQPDWTETCTILAHKLRNEHGVLTRFVVLSSESPYGDYQYVAIDWQSEGTEIASYGAVGFRKI